MYYSTMLDCHKHVRSLFGGISRTMSLHEDRPQCVGRELQRLLISNMGGPKIRERISA